MIFIMTQQQGGNWGVVLARVRQLCYNVRPRALQGALYRQF